MDIESFCEAATVLCHVVVVPLAVILGVMALSVLIVRGVPKN